MRTLSVIASAMLVFSLGAAAQEAAEPLDLATLDQEMVRDFLGTWVIRDESGKKKCQVVLHREAVISGYRIDVDKKCLKRFPVMDDVAGWRLLEGWQIVLVDPLRKEILRFYTPDDTYISSKEIDGIFSIEKR